MSRIEKIMEEKSVDDLMEIITKGELYEGIQAVFALGEIGEPAIKPLMAAMQDGKSDSRWGIAMALARIGPPAVDPLLLALGDSNPAVRNPSIWALAEIGDNRVVPQLIRVMQQESDCVTRAHIAAALLKIGDPRGITAVNQEFIRSGERFTDIAMESYEGS